MKNMPEAEGAALRISIVARGSLREVFCDPSEAIECDEADCALDLFDIYVKPYLGYGYGGVELIGIYVVRGGKMFKYRVGEDVVCLVLHRLDVDPRSICSSL